MPLSKLTNLFRTAIKVVPKILSPSPLPPPSSLNSAPSDNAATKQLIILSSIDKAVSKTSTTSSKKTSSSPSSSSSSSSSSAAAVEPKKKSKLKSKRILQGKSGLEEILNRKPEAEPLVETSSSSSGLEQDEAAASDITKLLWMEVSSTLQAEPQVAEDTSISNGNQSSSETYLNIPWLSTTCENNMSTFRKELSRRRKEKWIYKNSHELRFDHLAKMCAQKIGTNTTLSVFGKLGRSTGVKEYNALIGICIENARATDDKDAALEKISNAFELVKLMGEEGFEVGEDSYGPLLMYLIDKSMEEEFHFFVNIIKEDNTDAILRLSYYEMLLYARVDNVAKIQELCRNALCEDGGNIPELLSNYLLALSECDREEMLQLLEVIDIKRISSWDCLVSIFKSFGRLQLESLAKQSLSAYKSCDEGKKNISNLIFSYTANTPNLGVEDVIANVMSLHEEMDVTPCSTAYENLITFCCSLQKVYAALDIVDKMCKAGMTLSDKVLNTLLCATEECFEFHLVRQIYPMILRYNLKPNADTFRKMISLCVRIKDFDAAYDMLDDLKKVKLDPTPGMYNAILAGYFREKNVHAAMRVFNQMRDADVKPDSHTFSCLLGNCSSEEAINKYYEEMKSSGIQVTKNIYMQLINAYANCGLFEKAKQVISEKEIPVKSLNELKGALISALAANKQIDDALNIYHEMKQEGCIIEPKHVINLIENLQRRGELSMLLQLLDDLDANKNCWVDGCCRIISYCVKYLHQSAVVDLLKRVFNKVNNDELAMDSVFSKVFSLIAEGGPAHLLMGLDLLQVIKEDFGLSPSRKVLDFLLGACVNAKDLSSSLLVWKEYAAANLPYNILSYLWMYQALLAAEDYKAAKVLLRDIPKDDPHARSIIKACQKTYIKTSSTKKKKNVESGAS